MRTAKLKSSERSKDLAVEGLLGALLDMHMQKQSLEKLKQAGSASGAMAFNMFRMDCLGLPCTPEEYARKPHGGSSTQRS